MMKFSVVIPSSSDDAGLAEDYLSYGHINLLPFLEKTFIRYLVDDLAKNTTIADRTTGLYVITSESHRRQYEDALLGANSCFEVRARSAHEPKGILSTIKATLASVADPYFIIYGDTIAKDQVYTALVKEAEQLHEKCPREAWAVVALVEKPLDFESASQPWKELVRNRWGYILSEKKALVDQGESHDENTGYEVINERQLFDIVYRPAYPILDVSFRNFRPLIESGAMIISKALCELFLQNEENDPLGLLSIINAARLSFARSEFKIRGVIIGSEDWLDINYPWEYLIAQDYIAERRRWRAVRGRPQDDLANGHSVIVNHDQYVAWARRNGLLRDHCSDINDPPESIDQIQNQFYHEYDRKVIGVSRRISLSGSLTLPDHGYKDKPLEMFIGEDAKFTGNCVLRSGARIGGGATIRSSVVCEDALIDCDAVLEHSVILKGARILACSVIPYSIIGEYAEIAGGTMITCERQDPLGARRAGRYYARCSAIRHHHRFGAIVGDRAMIGSNTTIQPGRKIGKEALIYGGTVVLHNVPPRSETKSK